MENIATLISHIPFIKAKEESTKTPNRETILTQLRETGRQLEAVRSRFDLETDFDLIDSYILEMDSLEKRYAYWLKRARAEQINAFAQPQRSRFPWFQTAKE